MRRVRLIKAKRRNIRLELSPLQISKDDREKSTEIGS